MGFDWERVLGTNGVGLTDVYEEQASDALYQDHSGGLLRRELPSNWAIK
ncbi:hypothetical protein [Saccharopolyspora shandongensis]